MLFLRFIIIKKEITKSFSLIKKNIIEITLKTLSKLPLNIFLLIVDFCFKLIPSFRAKDELALCVQSRIDIQNKKDQYSSIISRKFAFEYLLANLDSKILSELEQCAIKINEYKSNLQTEKPIILAPMHFVSDLIVGVMSSMVEPRESVIISTHHDDALCSNENSSLLKLNIKMKKVDPTTIKLYELKSIIKIIKEKKANFVIYPDAPPEVTHHLTGKSMKTFKCSIFKHHAKAHSGIIELAKLSNADVLFYSLFYNKKNKEINIKIHGVSSANDLEMKIPMYIEKALCEHPDDWILWSSPSFFYYNSVC